MVGHKSITKDKPYITYDKSQISFVAIDFSDVPITCGYYAKQKGNINSKSGGRDS